LSSAGTRLARRRKGKRKKEEGKRQKAKDV
jgi:hypothetical protein